MTRNISIKDCLNEQLADMKGSYSFSYAIEQIMEKAGIPVARPSKDKLPAAAVIRHN